MSDMNFLERLLDGVKVEWKPLGQVATLRRGRVMSKEYLAENAGCHPVYSSQTANNGEIGKIKTFDFDGEFISWTTDGANAGTVFYRTGKFSVTNVCGLIKINNKKELNYRFLFYWLTTEAQKHVYSGMGNPKLMSHQVEKIPVPIPCPDNPEKSLAIQAEIVRILDTFTTLTAELTAELIDRKKQYNYYRDRLFLSIGDNEEKLGDIADICLGLTYTPTYVNSGVKFISAQNTSKDFLNLSNVKYISEDEYRKSTSNAKPKRGDVLFTRVGSNLGHPVIVDTDEPLCMFVSLGFIRVNPNKVLNSYINSSDRFQVSSGPKSAVI
jgi:type I restriction enzyme, S subunit